MPYCGEGLVVPNRMSYFTSVVCAALVAPIRLGSLQRLEAAQTAIQQLCGALGLVPFSNSSSVHILDSSKSLVQFRHQHHRQ